MGLPFSLQISKDITNGYMEVINQLTSKITTESNSTVGSVNRINLTVCGVKACGTGPCTIDGVNTKQSNNATFKLSVISLQNIVRNVKSGIANATNQYIQSTNTEQRSWLSYAFGINVQVQSTINNFVEKISNLISDSVSTTCSTSIIQDNDATVVLCGNITQPSNVVQRNDVLAAQSCISKQIVNNIISNSELYNGMQFADQQNYSSSGGPFDFLYYIGLFILFVIIIITIAGIIRYATRTPRPIAPTTQEARSLTPVRTIARV